MPWAAISDPTLDSNGKQTFNIFQTNLQDVLTRVKATTSKKIYITLKFWQGSFYSTHSGTTTSVSGSTITDTAGFGSTGWTQCDIGGHTYAVSASTTTTATLTGYAGGGGSYLLGKAKVNDASMWPAWLNGKNPAWVKAFFQTNTNARGQLDYDNINVWNAIQEMFLGMSQIIDTLDTDNRIDLIATGDESIAAVSDINGLPICNQTNYNSRFEALHLAIKPSYMDRTIWCPLSYGAGTADAAAMQSIFTNLQAAYPTGFGYGGPDTPLFGVHGNPSSWFTTFLNVLTGVTGTLGDVRDTCLRIGNTEGPGIGAGTGTNCPPALGAFQNIYNDVMTRINIPLTGGRPAHTGMGCSVMHWVYATRFCMKAADMVTLVNANNGSFTPLPPGNWDTSP
jgi:hypothetical protein